MRELPRLETQRLVLRVPAPADAAAMAAFATANRDHLAPWDPQRDPSYFTLEHWRAELERVVAQAREGSAFRFVLTAREEPVQPVLGTSSVTNIVRGPFQAAYLGYALDHRAVGRGLMTEALRAVVGFCFEDLNLHRLMANYMPTNARSAAVLRRLGFVPEGYARDYLRLAGAWQDHVLTALVNPAWQPG